MGVNNTPGSLNTLGHFKDARLFTWPAVCGVNAKSQIGGSMKTRQAFDYSLWTFKAHSLVNETVIPLWGDLEGQIMCTSIHEPNMDFTESFSTFKTVNNFIGCKMVRAAIISQGGPRDIRSNRFVINACRRGREHLHAISFINTCLRKADSCYSEPVERSFIRWTCWSALYRHNDTIR